MAQDSTIPPEETPEESPLDDLAEMQAEGASHDADSLETDDRVSAVDESEGAEDLNAADLEFKEDVASLLDSVEISEESSEADQADKEFSGNPATEEELAQAIGDAFGEDEPPIDKPDCSRAVNPR